MKNKKLYSLCLYAALCAFSGTVAQAQTAGVQSEGIEIDVASPQWKISEYLTGGHFVYGLENDTLYMDERISDFLKTSRSKVIRWPGGTVTQCYHWDDLTGIPYPVEYDSWGNKFNESMRKKPECYMDLDEYIAYCRKVGADPMVGINIRSGNKYQGPGKGLEGSLDEARRLIQYCKDKNYNVKNWYIGNESYIMFRKENYIKYSEFIDKYAEVLRAVDPDINIIGDWQFGGRLKQVVNLVRQSKHINMMEIHEKWGNGFGMKSGNTFEEWKHEYPIYKGQLGRYIDQFKDSVKVMGREDVKIAMNEWGLSGKNYADTDPFKCGLMAADFLMELYKHDVQMACYWNLNAGGADTKILKVQKDTVDYARTRLLEVTPVGNPFILLGSAGGKQMLSFTTPMQEVYGFAAVNEDQSAVDVYLLNKKEQEVTLPLTLQHFDGAQQMVQYCYENPGLIEEKTYEKGNFEMVLPALSFSRFVIQRGEATGIEPLPVETYQQSEVVFDLGGKQVSHPTKGVYIVNGKKLMIK